MSSYAKAQVTHEAKALFRVCRKASLIFALYQNYKLLSWFCKELRRRA